MAAPDFAPQPSATEISPPALQTIDYEPPILEVDTDRTRQSAIEIIDGYSITKRHYTLDDGRRYDAQIFDPTNPKFDIAVTYTTPWCTDLKGFNQYMGETLAAHGMVGIAISPERLSTSQLRRRFGSLSLEHDVHAQLAILNDIDKETRSQPGVSIDVGYSRGAMVGFGVNVYSNQYDRDIAYSDYIDPCLAHAVGVGDVTWPEIPGYLGKEVLALSKGLALTRPEVLRKMARAAVPPSACFWLQQVAVGKALFDGQAGDFITELHPDTTGFVTLYTKSRFNHADRYEEVLSRFPNIVLRRERGYHMTGVEPRVRNEVLGRVTLAQYMLTENAEPEAIAHAIRSVEFNASR